MSSESEYEHIYTGSLVNVQYLQSLLKERGIVSLTKDNLRSGLMAGFGGGVPGLIQLFVMKKDMDDALPIVEKSILKT